jgi:hypothetical protein
MKTIGLLLPGKLVSDLDFTAGAKLVNGPSGGVLLVFQHEDSGSCSSCRKKKCRSCLVLSDSEHFGER